MPKWILPLIGGIVGIAAAVVVSVVLVNTLAASQESLALDALAEMEGLAAVLERVEDEGAARAALAAIERSGERVSDLFRRAEELRESNPLSREDQDAVEKRISRARIRAFDRLNIQTRRISVDARLAAILSEPISQFVAKVNDARSAERRRDLDEWIQRQEEQRERARQAVAERMAAEGRQPPAGTPPGPLPTIDPGGRSTGSGAADGSVPQWPGPRPGEVSPRPQFGPQRFTARPGGPPFGPRAMDPGPDGVRIDLPKVDNLNDIRRRILEIAGRRSRVSTFTQNDESTVVLAPVADVERFASLIDFGTVTNVDVAGRQITVAPDPDYRFQPGAGTITAPEQP